jgi:hypothetical protein
MGIGQWASGIGHRELVITDDAAMPDGDAARTTRENTHETSAPPCPMMPDASPFGDAARTTFVTSARN